MVALRPRRPRATSPGCGASCPAGRSSCRSICPAPEYGVGLIGNPRQPPRGAAGARGRLHAACPPGSPRSCPIESKALPDSPYWTEIRFRRAEADAGGARAHGRPRASACSPGSAAATTAASTSAAAADGEPRLLEVNPNPAWANDGKLAFMAGFAGIAYPDMLKMILEAALAAWARV